MKILSLGSRKTGCWWIRLKMPLDELQKNGHYVAYSSEETPQPLEGWDVVIFSNIMGGTTVRDRNGKEKEVPMEEMIEDYKSKGSFIVYDTDDAQEVHPFKNREDVVGKNQNSSIEANLQNYFFLLKNADLVTCTTEHLKRHLQQFTDRPIEVLPNCVNPALFFKREKEKRVKIIYAGGDSHIPDANLALPSLYKLRNKYKIFVETMGFPLQYKDWKVKQKRHVSIDEYYQALSELNGDIGICPLLDNEFNLNKSPLKFLEYVMSGTMCLASNRLPYKGEMKAEWLVDDDKWEETLEKYILDKDLRERTLKEQREWVLKHRDIRKEWKRWEKAYLSLIKNNIYISNSPELKISPMPENAGEVLKYVVSKLKMPFWISAGTALGLYRDKDFIEGDTDLDIAMEGYKGVDEDVVEAIRGDIMRTIYDYQDRPMQLAILKDGVLVDFYFHYKNGKNLENHGESGWTRMPKDICLKPQMIKTKYGKLPFPQEKYFEIRYGEDWKIPQDKKPKFYEV